MRKLMITSLILTSFALTSCLKTRAQLKNEEDDQGVEASPKAIQPQSSYAIDEIRSEITRLNGRMDDLERNSKENEVGEDGEEKVPIDQRMAELEQNQIRILERLKMLEKNIAMPDPSKLLDKGKAAYRDKKFDRAIKDLSEYLQHKRAKWKSEAYYYRAESYYGKKQFKKAISDYSKIYEKYKKSKRYTNTILMLGRSFDRLGMKEEAQAFYQELVDDYPKSKDAKRAKKRLK